jgi:hypothetical protein
MVVKYQILNNGIIINVLHDNSFPPPLRSRTDNLDFSSHKFYYESNYIYWIEEDSISLIDIKNDLESRIPTLNFGSEKNALDVVINYLREEKINSILDTNESTHPMLTTAHDSYEYP